MKFFPDPLIMDLPNWLDRFPDGTMFRLMKLTPRETGEGGVSLVGLQQHPQGEVYMVDVKADPPLKKAKLEEVLYRRQSGLYGSDWVLDAKAYCEDLGYTFIKILREEDL